MSNTNDKVKAMMDFYAENTAKKTKPKKEKFNQEELFKKYLTLFLPDGVKEGEKTIRILPNPNGNVPFEVIKVHYRKKSSKKNEFDKYLCLKENFDESCPFCEAKNELYAKGKNDIAKEYLAKSLYIAKVIDRDAEEEGVKFWRFSKSILDQLITFAKIKKIDIDNPETGVDIVINLKKDENGATKVAGMVDMGPSKLSENPDQLKEWLSHSLTWKDVYKKYPYDYLLVIVEGGTPVWSKEANEGKGGYINKDKEDVSSADNSETTIGGEDIAGDVANSASSDDDLPF